MMTTHRQIDASLSHSILDESEESNLTPRDTGVLQTVMEEGLTVFTFDGLKRLTGLHQEKLSRIIDRLEEEGLLEKVCEGCPPVTRTCFGTIRYANSPAPASGLPDSLLPQHGFRLDCDRYSVLTGQQIGHLPLQG